MWGGFSDVDSQGSDDWDSGGDEQDHKYESKVTEIRHPIIFETAMSTRPDSKKKPRTVESFSVGNIAKCPLVTIEFATSVSQIFEYKTLGLCSCRTIILYTAINSSDLTVLSSAHWCRPLYDM